MDFSNYWMQCYDIVSSLVCIIILVCILALLFIIFYMKLTCGRCISKALLCGKTVLITGSDKGIGYEAALNLAGRKARVIMACRDVENAEKSANKIRLLTKNEQVYVRQIDLSSLANVRKFAEGFLKDEKKLDVLINNAGMPADSTELVRTSEGFEKVFVTNYLSHFLLTMLLLDTVKKSAPSRIINVSSKLHIFIKPDELRDLNSEESFSRGHLYGRSKLLQVLFTKELARQLAGTGVTVNCLHPGIVKTNIFSKLPDSSFKVLVNMASGIFFKTPEEGAQTTIHLAVSEDLETVSGEYFENCKVASASMVAQDLGLAKKVFEASESYCGIASAS